MSQMTMEHTNTREFTVRGKTFTSPYTDAEIVTKLIELGQANKLGSSTNFARDLVMGYRKWKKFTDRQRPHAHEMVISREQPQQPKGRLIAGFIAIYQHLQACRQRRDEGGAGLLSPMIAIGNGEPEILQGVRFVMKWTGPKSKRPNHVAVSECAGYGQGKFYGYINEQGEFERYNACPDLVVQYLERITKNPRVEISAIGRESGLCCYCRAGLTQVQSKIAGCGKTCARKYEVWWPNAAETRTYVLDNPQVLRGATDQDRWS
jgi:hypothetical protein